MRCSRHNGRAGKNGTYNPKHNDREFDVKNSEDINSDLTDFNVYWNCIDHQLVRHRDRNENSNSFAEVEKAFYDLVYKDYLEGQNNRHIASRHKERIKTMDEIRENKKTCPEETIYQIGNIDGSVDYDVLLTVAAEFFNTIMDRFGEHVHILDWALHLDESTPHIHERHVFDVINKYGERQPKQEQALKELGFELPFPDKKPGKYNNRKMSYDAECRKIFISICKKHGLDIEEEPIYGGKKYLEKKEFIINKLNADYNKLKEQFNELNSKYDVLLAENKRLSDTKASLEVKIEDMEGLVKEVSDIAYEKACDVLVDEIVDKAQGENAKLVNEYKNWIVSDKCKVPKAAKKLIADVLNKLSMEVGKLKTKIVAKVKANLLSSDKKKAYTSEIVNKARPSIMDILEKAKHEADELNKSRKPVNQLKSAKREELR